MYIVILCCYVILHIIKSIYMAATNATLDSYQHRRRNTNKLYLKRLCCISSSIVKSNLISHFVMIFFCDDLFNVHESAYNSSEHTALLASLFFIKLFLAFTVGLLSEFYVSITF